LSRQLNDNFVWVGIPICHGGRLDQIGAYWWEYWLVKNQCLFHPKYVQGKDVTSMGRVLDR